MRNAYETTNRSLSRRPLYDVELLLLLRYQQTVGLALRIRLGKLCGVRRMRPPGQGSWTVGPAKETHK